MSYKEFCEWIELNCLRNGDIDDTSDLLALIGIWWVEQQRKHRPDLSLDEIAAAMFAGSPFLQ